MNRIYYLYSLLFILIFSCNNQTHISAENIDVDPISHATFILKIDELTVYVDPVGEKERFKEKPAADLILVTDIHGDHLNKETLRSVMGKNTKVVVPKAVAQRLEDSIRSNLIILNNLEMSDFEIGKNKLHIQAVPMYNLREEAKDFHTKGRGNGYVLEIGGFRIYISGDTEDIPEMRGLKDIDMAFVCMNLPWTMTVEKAADAVNDFKPKIVYPYHYRGRNGLSDVREFEKLVQEKNAQIDVRLLNWYPNR